MLIPKAAACGGAVGWQGGRAMPITNLRLHALPALVKQVDCQLVQRDIHLVRHPDLLALCIGDGVGLALRVRRGLVLPHALAKPGWECVPGER